MNSAVGLVCQKQHNDVLFELLVEQAEVLLVEQVGVLLVEQVEVLLDGLILADDTLSW